jgi:DNA adenine methylase
MTTLPAPFPWFGGKRKVASEVWTRFGVVRNYVEPFFGSGAVLLGRPGGAIGNETVNDLDGLVANFWRSVSRSPEATAEWADHLVNENDLHARHAWLLGELPTLRPRLEGDPEWHDPKIAGWWVWGVSCWIGSGFCSGDGPWVVDENRQLVHLGNGRGVKRQRVHLGNNGRGVNRQLVHLGNGQGVNRQRVHLGNNGQGVNRQRVHLGDNGQGVNRLLPWFSALSERLRRVRICSGDWARVCGPSVTFKHGMTAVFLDPPYADTAERTVDLYREDCEQVAHAVREWAIANGENPLLRIALCGYDGEHQMPASWAMYRWSAGDGFGGQAEERTGNGDREVIWFSPACLSAKQGILFSA